MPFAVFYVPVIHGEVAQAEMNAFLSNHRVLRVERQFVSQSDASFWTFCVDYSDGKRPATGGTSGASSRPKIDYQNVLSPEDFKIYVRLRDLRKELAAAESVPVYIIFSNEQLAEIARRKATTKAALGKIEGLGNGKLEKYGDRILKVVAPT
ncbi:MAG: HRDC domain-containing protein [Planctomycetaceae bacterium]